MTQKESKFEQHVVKRIEKMYPGAMVLKVHPNYRPGFPDRIALYGDHYYVFETKREANAPFQPNQQYYIDSINAMSRYSGSTVVHPGNEKEFFDEIQRAFGSLRFTRVSKS